MPLEAMSSIIALIGLLGKLFQILLLQPLHEIYIMTLQCELKKRVTLLQYLKTICIPSSGLLFSSVCAECTGPNIDILIFPLLVLKLFLFQLVAFLLLSLVYIECAAYLYTNCDVKLQTYMFTS